MGLFIRQENLGKPARQNEIDLSNPVALILFTAAYIVVIFFLIIGVPWRGSSTPIPPEDLGVAIPVFIVLYIFIAGGFYLRDKIRKNRDSGSL